jgi:hypothetical protein
MVGLVFVCEELLQEGEARIAEFLRLGVNALDKLDAMDLSEAARDPFRVSLGLNTALLPSPSDACDSHKRMLTVSGDEVVTSPSAAEV